MFEARGRDGVDVSGMEKTTLRSILQLIMLVAITTLAVASHRSIPKNTMWTNTFPVMESRSERGVYNHFNPMRFDGVFPAGSRPYQVNVSVQSRTIPPLWGVYVEYLIVDVLDNRLGKSPDQHVSERVITGAVPLYSELQGAKGQVGKQLRVNKSTAWSIVRATSVVVATVVVCMLLRNAVWLYRRWYRASQRRCCECGYPLMLTGATSCPECGSTYSSQDVWPIKVSGGSTSQDKACGGE